MEFTQIQQKEYECMPIHFLRYLLISREPRKDLLTDFTINLFIYNVSAAGVISGRVLPQLGLGRVWGHILACIMSQYGQPCAFCQ